MNLSSKFVCISLLITTISVSFGQQKPGQDPNDPRKSEEDIILEDKFVSAKYLSLLGKTDEAIKILDTIRRELPNNPTIYFELAKLYYTKKEYTQAEILLLKAVQLDPQAYHLREYETSFYNEIGRNEKVIEAYNALIKINPSNPEYYDNLSKFLIKKEKFKESLTILDSKELTLGFSENVVIQKAEVYDLMGLTSKALDQLDRLISKYPFDITYLKLAISMLQSNDERKATIPYLKKLLLLQPDDNEAKLALMVAENKTINNDGDFLVMMQPLISNPQIDIDTKIKELLPLVIKHAETKDTILGKNLTTICDKLVIAHPTESKAHAVYADVLMNSEKTEAAIIQYEKALSYHKSNFMIWEQLMNGLNKVGNYVELDKVANEAIEYFPNKAISYYYVGKAAAISNNPKKADEFLNEAILISSNNSILTTYITALQGYVEFKKSNKEKAISLLLSAIDMSQKTYGEAFEWLGDVYKSQNQVIKANEMYQMAIKLGRKPTTI